MTQGQVPASRPLTLLAAIAILAAAPLAAQSIAPLRIPTILDPNACDRTGPDADAVVCGRRTAPDRYRIPPALREDRTNPVNPSWSARARDERELGRFDGQTIGPSGAFKSSLQTACEWYAERQMLAGHPPDCTRRVRAPGN